jgi:hypothetical protein
MVRQIANRERHSSSAPGASVACTPNNFRRYFPATITP